MKCVYCGAPIQSKKDLMAGFSWIFITYTAIGLIRPYHLQCFKERNMKMASYPIASVDMVNLPRQKKLNQRVLVITVLTYFIVLLSTVFFYNIPLTWWWAVGIFVVWVAFLGFAPITNLIYLKKIEQLPEG